MEYRRVQCPACGALLRLPPGYVNRFVRCGRCKARLRLPRRIRVTDDAIVSWLRENRDSEIQQPVEQGVRLAGDAPVSGETIVAPAIGGNVRLVKVDPSGALFEFPASKLTDSHFRCGLPRRCLRCGSRTHLHTHLVIYTPKFRDSVVVERERSICQPRISDEDLSRLDNNALLRRLPRVTDVPRPADLAMPYWICDSCVGAAPLAAQIQTNPRTGEKICRLLIKSLERAEEFLAAVSGTNSPDYLRLRACIEAHAADPWAALPVTIRNNLQEWFHPAKGEEFLAYIPDRENEAKDGSSGLVVSSRRLVRHTSREQEEISASEPMEVKMKLSQHSANLEIRSSSCHIRNLQLDRNAARKLRQTLAAAKYRVSWK